MLTVDIANDFARDWINAFNSHNLDEILKHYAEDIEFYSPFIIVLKFNDKGVIQNKTDLKKYFEIGLKAYPNLHFKFHHCLVGINTLVIYYTSVNNKLAAEVFELNENNKAVRVICNYTNAD
jgi:hypothetical protein